MFDIGFFELVVIGLVSLLVLGPERLPRVARTAGALMGRLRQYAGEVKAEIDREIDLREFKTLQAEVSASARELQDSVRQEIAAVQEVFTETGKQEPAHEETTTMEIPAPVPSVNQAETQGASASGMLAADKTTTPPFDQTTPVA
ncbi:MAG: Sec-independent protein translocase protein TatB [Zoogloeaceae bacterium]|jgi:sec-independent protein translocase protein TatB|nr:Sec-independent protein translocase protein TatB [Zoogloeaceae bacterium]